ncbi:MAG TPA: hypothetical protein VL588_02875, partial [Bdellovibrionota bacterium]|nr:hypothetical protein [Bdellovibrionota bacterium]
YLGADHPDRPELTELRRIFHTPGAPSESELKGCTQEVSHHLSAADATAYVAKDARHAHWCFYRAILDLEQELKRLPGYLERKEAMIHAYGGLVPLARAFSETLHDARYLRFATTHYRQVSSWLFARTLEPTPGSQAAAWKDRTSNPFPAWRPLQQRDGTVLNKYGIQVTPEKGAPMAPVPARVPAGELHTPDAPATADMLAPPVEQTAAPLPPTPEGTTDQPVQTSRQAPIRRFRRR